ncbi:hypothetical protein AHAS_Ahas14G0142300 [Arachis hypogaea]
MEEFLNKYLLIKRTNSKISFRILEPSSKELPNSQKRNTCHSIMCFKISRRFI